MIQYEDHAKGYLILAYDLIGVPHARAVEKGYTSPPKNAALEKHVAIEKVAATGGFVSEALSE